MTRRGVWRVRRAAAGSLALVLLGPAQARAPEGVVLPAQARVGIVNLLDAEVTHFHAARQVQDSFLKTVPVRWAVDVMLAQAAGPALEQQRLSAVPVANAPALRRLREECLVNANPDKGLSKACAAGFAAAAAAEHVDALLILGPAGNDGSHGPRRKELPDYMRGWCAVTGLATAPASALLNLTELLVVVATPKGAVLAAHEWGGAAAGAWAGFAPGADLRALTAGELDPLQPLFGDLLKQQTGAALARVAVAPR
ncbi:MAG: hypothetical protein JOZ67_06515 [Gammaproteobacteria bacterium]|nr:hypothetical protein [Gammaproteobacteria bacterium]MBV9695312.1 hypothetical protein [Gammaproteobacteria bacterium]